MGNDVDQANAGGGLLRSAAPTPMVMVSRLTGAWIPAGEGDVPDGWLTLALEDIQQMWLCIERTHAGTDHRVSNLPGGPAHCFFTGKPEHLPGCGEKILVDLP